MALDYSNLGWSYILKKQYTKALFYLKKGEAVDASNLYLQGNLAHAYMLTGDFEKGFSIYRKYKGEIVAENLSWEKVRNKISNYLSKEEYLVIDVRRYWMYYTIYSL